MNFFKEINTLLKTRSVFLFYLILLLSIFTSFFDVLSLGSVGVLIGIILKPGFLNDYSNFIFINDFLKLSHVNQIYFGCVSIVILFLIKTVFIFLVFFLQGKFNYKIKKELSTKLFSAYLSKEYLFHVNNNPAILWRNINEEVDYTSQYLDLLSRLFGAICVILILFTLIIFTTPMINFSITIFLILSLLIVIFYINFKKKIKKRSEIRLNAASSLLKNVEQALSSIKETILYNKKNLFIKKFEELIELKGRQGFVINIINYLPRIFIELISILIITSLVFYYTFNNYDLGTLLAFLSFLTLSLIRLIPSFNLVSMCINSMRYVKNSKKIVLKELKNFESYKLDSQNDNQKKLNFTDYIELKDIYFQYAGEKSFSLKNINLKIKKGQKICIIGPSGSGKSTLINILTGLIKPKNGQALFDGKSIFENLEDWRANIGYIPQDIYLLDDTIKKNITFLDEEKLIDESYFKEVLKITELEKFIEELPEGNETLLGHKAIKISGGQRQRIAIARALYRKPSIIIMDEPTSALDLDTRKNLLNNFFRKYKEITLIMISHDISSFENKFDKIIKINNGRIVQ